MATKTGLDNLIAENFSPLRGHKVGLLCNQASISGEYLHAIQLFYEAHREGKFQLKALFGPQHGIWGHTQDNMIEWESFQDPDFGIPVYSLYGETRQPTPNMLRDIDILVVDLQDVGSRYYTFIWTLALCLKACAENEVKMLVLDRPNPLNGVALEGPLIEENYRSFVGLYPIPVRHGMTIGEIATYLNGEFQLGARLSVQKMSNWKRTYFFNETGLPWGMPSPNVPIWETTLVYPGMCLFEGTNISEGRGTTRPFEIFGAPWLDCWQLTESLNKLNLPGVFFRPYQFQPTFNKFSGELCQGAFIHVTDPSKFKPFRTGLALLQKITQLSGELFHWKAPPYEYEYQKLPFDILVGNSWIRKFLVEQVGIAEIENKWQIELEEFSRLREKYLLY